MVRRNNPSRNGTVTGRAGAECMLSAPVTRSADSRSSARGAWRLQAPTVPGIAAPKVADHLPCLHTVYDDRFGRKYGPCQ